MNRLSFRDGYGHNDSTISTDICCCIGVVVVVVVVVLLNDI